MVTIAEPGSAAPSVKNPMIGFYRISGMDRESLARRNMTVRVAMRFPHDSDIRIIPESGQNRRQNRGRIAYSDRR